MNKKYSPTVLKLAKTIQADDIWFNKKTNEFEVRYKIRMNKKTRKWMCSCHNSQFSTAQNRYCKHILSVLYNYDRNAYNQEIEKSKNE